MCERSCDKAEAATATLAMTTPPSSDITEDTPARITAASPAIIGVISPAMISTTTMHGIGYSMAVILYSPL
jgi:hypothetical protein